MRLRIVLDTISRALGVGLHALSLPRLAISSGLSRRSSTSLRAGFVKVRLRRWIIPNGRCHGDPSIWTANSDPVSASRRTVGAGNKATPDPISTARLMFSTLSKRCTKSTEMPACLNQRSICLRIVSSEVKPTNDSPSNSCRRHRRATCIADARGARPAPSPGFARGRRRFHFRFEDTTQSPSRIRR